MNDKKLNSENREKLIEISKEDMFYLYNTMEELNDFFHQPMNYERKENLDKFLGNKEKGAYHAISKCYYDILWKYLPKDKKTEIENSQH